jgi:uncharacterized LabA/DUF88 family protein
METCIYIDGFNLYYGSLKRTPYKWLNPLALMRQVLPPTYAIRRIKYFTARVSGAEDPDSPNRQAAYLRALKTLPEVEIFLGSFLAKNIWRPVVNLPVGGAQIHTPLAPVSMGVGAHAVALPSGAAQVLSVGTYPARGSRRPRIRQPVRDAIRCEVHAMEEKGSDVNLAVHLLNDAWNDAFGAAVVVSNDTDLITPIEMVTRERGKTVVIACPDRSRSASPKLAAVASSVRHIRPPMLAAAQFPVVMGTIRKPATW